MRDVTQVRHKDAITCNSLIIGFILKMKYLRWASVLKARFFGSLASLNKQIA
jgi:hypothetical protein